MKIAARRPSFACQSSSREILVGAVLAQHLMVFGMRHQPVRGLPGGARMDPVVAGDDRGRHRHRAQFGRAQPDHRVVGALVEALPPALHARDKILGCDRRQPRAVRRIGADHRAEMLARAHRRHAARFGQLDKLRVVLLHQALGRIGAAGHPPQQQAAHRRRVAQRQEQRQPATGRAAADKGRQRVEMQQQLAQILGPDLVLGIALERHARGAAIAPVIDQDPVAGLGQFLAERFDPVEPAPSARLQRHPRPAPAQNLVIDLDPADRRNRHGSPPSKVCDTLADPRIARRRIDWPTRPPRQARRRHGDAPAIAWAFPAAAVARRFRSNLCGTPSRRSSQIAHQPNRHPDAPENPPGKCHL